MSSKIRDIHKVREHTLQDSVREKRTCDFGGIDSMTPRFVIRLFSLSLVHKYARMCQVCWITEFAKFAEPWKLITVTTTTFYSINLFMFI